MKRLIVNADDFGLTRGVNAGVILAHLRGILTSTTLMANGEAFEDAVHQAHENPGLGVGCHLVLVGGPAIARREEIGRLAGPDGDLPETVGRLVKKLALGRVKQEELEAELRAQIRKIRAAGVQPTHVDTHKHTHLYPMVMKALVRVTSEFGIRAVRKPYEDLRTLLGRERGGRRSGGEWGRSMAAAAARIGRGRFQRLAQANGLGTADYFFGLRWTGRLEVQQVLQLLERLPEGTTELMCHPGLIDGDLQNAWTRLKQERECELKALTAPEVEQAVRERGIELISYRELTQADA